MATPESVTHSSEAVHQLLECPVCKERFQSPKLLPCQHTFCLPCLERLVEGTSLRCPECRAEHRVPPLPPSYFPDNLIVAGLLDLPQLADARPTGEGAAVASRAVPQQNVSSPASHRAATASPGGINYQEKVRAVACFGEKGQGERQFWCPSGVAVAPLDDVILVADTGNHRVQVFDNTGVYVMTFGGKGRGDGQFHYPSGIAVNGIGQVIVSDSNNHRIQIFDSKGNFQRAFGSQGAGDAQFNRPGGVACDRTGCIYVCDTGNKRIQVFKAIGIFVRQFSLPGNDKQGFIPKWVAVSADNQVYVSDFDNHRIHVFSLRGDFLFSFGSEGSMPGQVKNPVGIAIDSQGFVVVGDSGNDRVQVFHADGRFYSTLGSAGSKTGHVGQFGVITGVAIMSNGNLMVVGMVSNRIQIF